MAGDRAPTILFVCHHGSAKSVIAAALCERLAAAERVPVRALARGTEPDPAVPAPVVEGLRAAGIEVSRERPRSASREELASAARIVSFGPGLDVDDVIYWDVPAVGDAGYEATHAAIAARVAAFVAELRVHR